MLQTTWYQPINEFDAIPQGLVLSNLICFIIYYILYITYILSKDFKHILNTDHSNSQFSINI